ncbi:MAG: hypothetical protein QOI57_2850 [Rubrobacteraceae bacterium]|jgi:hypothetical protein|nr:hypothetical protein [Rubrobacteraceae bacterium]
MAVKVEEEGVVTVALGSWELVEGSWELVEGFWEPVEGLWFPGLRGKQ